MLQSVDRASKRQHSEQTRRQFLRRAAALAGVFVPLCTMREASAGWSSLGGYLTSRPAVGRNQDGRLELFAPSSNNVLYHIWQVAPNGEWSGWTPLGGIANSNTAVSSNLDGRLELFVYGTDKALYHRSQATPNGDWDDYSGLGGILKGDPTAVRNLDGRLEVFVRGIDNKIYNRWQVAPSGSWSNWAAFGADVTSNIAAIATNSGGGLNVFWRGLDDRLYWKRQRQANGPWEGIRKLGGPTIAGDPVVAEFHGQHSDARLVVFVRSIDNATWYRYQTQPNGTTWSDWISLGGIATRNVAVGTNLDGRLELFVCGPNGSVYRNAQTAIDSTASWTGWQFFEGYLLSDPAVGMNQDGRLEIFGIGLDRALWQRWQVTPGGGWG